MWSFWSPKWAHLLSFVLRWAMEAQLPFLNQPNLQDKVAEQVLEAKRDLYTLVYKLYILVYTGYSRYTYWYTLSVYSREIGP